MVKIIQRSLIFGVCVCVLFVLDPTQEAKSLTFLSTESQTRGGVFYQMEIISIICNLCIPATDIWVLIVLLRNSLSGGYRRRHHKFYICTLL